MLDHLLQPVEKTFVIRTFSQIYDNNDTRLFSDDGFQFKIVTLILEII